MMLISPPPELYENEELHKISSYINLKGYHPEPKTVMHPCFVVFKKEDMTKNTWLFISEDQDAIEKMQGLKLYNSLLCVL